MSKALRYRMWSYKRQILNYPPLVDISVESSLISDVCVIKNMSKRLAIECGHISASSEPIPLWWIYLLNHYWFQMYVLSRICPRRLAIECGHISASSEPIPLWWIYLLNHHWFQMYMLSRIRPRRLATECGHISAPSRRLFWDSPGTRGDPGVTRGPRFPVILGIYNFF